MLVSLNWLREYVDLPDDIESLAHRLTMASAEVEGIERVGGWDRGLITVGSVVAVDPHPDADRLRLATVDYGGDEPLQVVCGAPNLVVGQRVAFAREGATIIDARNGEPGVLKRAKIRGFESTGMVLSERELGLSDEHEGIIELPADAPVGTPLADYLGDTILDVHTWPNRADTMSMIGLAREIAAITGAPEVRVPPTADPTGERAVGDAAAVAIDDPDLCARYVATVIEGITVGPSPGWMQERLRAAGMRPISNVVDITNYVMLEFGQPLHAFDVDTVRGTIVVRTAREGETLRTLDGEDRTLTPDMLLITDDRGPIALAGVMGGESTEVTEGTTRVLLEAAQFHPTSIRRTSTGLHLRSEASSRFERGLTPELAIHAARRATRLFEELCGGRALAGVVDTYPRPQEPVAVEVDRQRLDTLIGLSVPSDEVEAGLQRLGFEIERSGSSADERFTVRVPWWRTDIAIPDDIAEEVVRITGYDLLPATTLSGSVPAYEADPPEQLRADVRDILAAAGLREVITYSLTTDGVLRQVVPAEELALVPPLRLLNTLSAAQEVLRPTLRHSLLETVAGNINAGATEIAIFEVAHVYRPRRGADGPLPDERDLVTGAISGRGLDRWGSPTDRELDLFDAKGPIEELAEVLGVTFEFIPAQEFGMLPGRTAHLAVADEVVGLLAEVHPDTLRAFDIEQPVALFEVDLARLLPHLPQRRTARGVPRFPAVEQDLAVVVDDGVAAGALRRALESSELIAAVRLFDEYRGEQLPAGKKSVAFALRYQASDRTLTGEDANREQARLMRRLEAEFGAEPRA